MFSGLRRLPDPARGLLLDYAWASADANLPVPGLHLQTVDRARFSGAAFPGDELSVELAWAQQGRTSGPARSPSPPRAARPRPRGCATARRPRGDRAGRNRPAAPAPAPDAAGGPDRRGRTG
ncbi:hypothetical protein ACFQ0M_11765 [Kitasatospora aburaviensis]